MSAQAREQLKLGVLAIAAVTVVVFCVLLLTPGIESGPASTHAVYHNRLKMAHYAIKAYEADRGHLPPPYCAGAGADKLVSWRVLLLKYMDYERVYAQYDFDQMWNSHQNLAFAERVGVPSEYRYPRGESGDPAVTPFVAVVGPGTAWSAADPVKFSEITDCAANLILLVGLSDSDIHWMEPRDLDIEQFVTDIERQPNAETHRRLAGCVLFADGKVWHLRDDCPEQEIAKFFTIEGARKYNRDQVLGPYRR